MITILNKIGLKNFPIHFMTTFKVSTSALSNKTAIFSVYLLGLFQRCLLFLGHHSISVFIICFLSFYVSCPLLFLLITCIIFLTLVRCLIHVDLFLSLRVSLRIAPVISIVRISSMIQATLTFSGINRLMFRL